MADEQIMKCVSCAVGESFMDLPDGVTERRWGVDEGPQTMCSHCGFWYPVSSVDPKARFDFDPTCPTAAKFFDHLVGVGAIEAPEEEGD